VALWSGARPPDKAGSAMQLIGASDGNLYGSTVYGIYGATALLPEGMDGKICGVPR